MKKYLKFTFMGSFMSVIYINDIYAETERLSCQTTYDNGERYVSDEVNVAYNSSDDLEPTDVAVYFRKYKQTVTAVKKHGGKIYQITGGTSYSTWVLEKLFDKPNQGIAAWKKTYSFGPNPTHPVVFNDCIASPGF